MRNRIIHLQYSESCLYKGKIWFLNQGFNGLFSLDPNDFTLTFQAQIPSLDVGQMKELYSISCLSYENKLYFFYINSRHVAIYDLNNNKIQWQLISQTDGLEKEGLAGVVKCKNQVWLLSINPNLGPWILDLNTLKVKKDIKLHGLLKNLERIKRVISIGESEIAILLENSTIVCIDIKNKQKVYSKCFEENGHLAEIKYDGAAYWLLQADSTDIFEWNRKEDKLVKYQLSETEKIDGMNILPYADLIFFKGQLIILPGKLKNIMKLNKETGIISKAIDYPAGFRRLNNYFGVAGLPVLSAYNIIDDKIYIHPLAGNMLLCYDVERNYIEGKELVVTDKEFFYFGEALKQGLEINGEFFETEDIGGIESLKEIIEENCISGLRNIEKGIGKKIHQVISQ